MSGISHAQVEAELKRIEEVKQSLPVGSDIKHSLDVINETIEMLKLCWNTTGGAEEQAKLKQITETGLNCAAISSSIETLKALSITTSTTTFYDYSRASSHVITD